MARGAALIAMFVYHLAWDAHFVGLSASDPSTGGWKIFAHVIASSFLFLAGLSLALADRQGKPRAAILRRIAVVAAAAAAVSLATYFFAPEAFVSFGILHCIVVASLLALPLLRAPPWLLAVAAIAAIAAPQFLQSPALDGPWLDWTGLNIAVPRTLDWRPLLPWSGAVFAGVLAGRLGAGRLMALRAPAPAPMHALAFAGRHSLPTYLLHQPVFLALLFGLSAAVGSAERREAAPFLNACAQACADAGRSAALCAASCACVMGKLKDAGLWRAALRNGLDAAGAARVREMGKACQAAAP